MADGTEDTLADPAAAPSPLPETIGRYRIERVLGEGGMGSCTPSSISSDA